ncbi:hypothetical protein MRB53_037798 [Persea americana]|nr:hypothetical protein MRB53_037798 [Persea americana]
MNQTQRTRLLDQRQILHNLVVVVARHGPDQQRHGPRVYRANVRPADAAERPAVEEVRVALLAEDHAARVLVDLIVSIDEAQQRQGEETWQVRVVHQDAGTVAVDLEGEDVAPLLVVDNTVLVDAPADGLATGG